MTDVEHDQLRQIISNMDSLVKNVIILGSPDYLTRGWCLYEYIVASLTNQTVCDEIHEPRFVTLRDWASTHPPVPWTNPKA